MSSEQEVEKLRRRLDREKKRRLQAEEIAETSTRRLYDALRETVESREALERSNIDLQQFAYTASHDLQTPLRGIATLAGMLHADYEAVLDETGVSYIQRILRSVSRLRQQIMDLLEFSRVETGSEPFGEVDLNEVFDDALRILEPVVTGKNAMVTRGVLPVVTGDHGQLGQVLQNLIENAIKYNDRESPSVHVDMQNKSESWMIWVRDRGIGIESEFHERVFDVFRRLHTEKEFSGTGIGLAICKRILERHKGKIWLESEPGQGTTVYFSIPKNLDQP